MALFAANCPSCGAALNLDDSREFGYCTYCGCEVLQEIKRVKVTIDTSKRSMNCLKLADQAFEVGNYLEAYNYYTRVLEYDGDAYVAIMRKGICAGYLSDPTNIRIAELISGYEQAISTASDVIGNRRDARFNLLTEKSNLTDEMTQFAVSYVSHFRSRNDQIMYERRTDIDYYFSCLLNVLSMLTAINDALDDAYEMHKKAMILYIIELCDAAQGRFYSCTYHDGNSTGVFGMLVAQYSPYRANKETISWIKETRENAARGYINLVSHSKQLRSFNAEMAENEAAIEAYKNNLASFWKENPCARKKYRNIKVLSVTFTILACFIFFVAGVFLPPLLLLIPACIIFRGTITSRVLRNFEEEHFSSDLYNQKTRSIESAKMIKEIAKEKEAFMMSLVR